MEKPLYKSLLVVLLFYSSLSLVYAQKKPDIRGNKSVAVVDKVLDPFYAIVVEEDMALSFKKGEHPMVHFIADDNLPPVFKFEVKDSVLHISSYYRIRSYKELKIEVTYVALESIDIVEGVVKLAINSNPSALAITTKNKAEVEVFGMADSVSLNLNDNSRVKLTSSLNQLTAEVAHRSQLTLSGKFLTSTIALSGRAAVVGHGTTDELDLKLAAESYFDGKALKVDRAIVAMNDTSVADVYAEQSLALSLNQQARLNFYGNAHLEINQFLGSSQLHKIPVSSSKQ